MRDFQQRSRRFSGFSLRDLRILCDLCGLGFGKIKVKPFTAKSAKDSAKDAKERLPNDQLCAMSGE
jgi:hypothetical protein